MRRCQSQSQSQSAIRSRPGRQPPVDARMSTIEHRFGPYGGQYVPETLMPALAELELAWIEARDDPGFIARA